MAETIIRETDSQIMAVCMNMWINVCVLREKDRKTKQGQAAGYMGGRVLFALQEMMSERKNVHPLSQNVPHYKVRPLCLTPKQCTTKMTLIIN